MTFWIVRLEMPTVVAAAFWPSGAMPEMRKPRNAEPPSSVEPLASIPTEPATSGRLDASAIVPTLPENVMVLVPPAALASVIA